MWQKCKGWLRHNEWIVVVLAVAVLLRVPTLFEPYWYGDEGIYLTIGQALRQGANLYRDIHDNKPPFLYWITAIAAGNQFWYRFITIMWNLVTVGLFFKLAEKIFGEEGWGVKIAVWSFVLLTNLPFLEGNVANAELYFLLLTVGAAVWLWERQASAKGIFLGGVMLGLGGLFKIPAVLEAGVWPMVWWANGEKKWLRNSIILAGGVILPLAISGVWWASRGVLNEYLIAAGVQNVGYLSTWKVGSGTGIYTLKGRAVVLIIWLGGLWGLAKRVGRRGLIIGVWGGLTLFGVLLSGRPYPHYFIQMAGVLAVIAGVGVSGKTSERVVGTLVVGMVVGAFMIFNFKGYSVGGYYLNFGRWVTGRIAREEYFTWFNPQVNVNYEVAKVIMAGSKPEEKIFIWGDEPMVYALAKRLPEGRFTVKYHIKDFKAEKEIMGRLAQEPPKYIVSYGAEEELPGLTALLEWRYEKVREIKGATVYRLAGLAWWKY